MKTTLLLFVTLFMLLLSACEWKHKEQIDAVQCTVRINGYVGPAPLSFINTIYNDSIQKEFYFSKLKFYLSHVKFIRPDNSTVDVATSVFFDQSDSTWQSFRPFVPPGTYTGITFSVGLDSAQNATIPSNYSDLTDPLSPHEDTYWDWLKHRFITLEGTADTIGHNFTGNVTTLAYHVGTDECYTTYTINGPQFTVDNMGNVINLNFNLWTTFYGAPSPIDMFNEPGTQSDSHTAVQFAARFANQFARSFTYSL